jgi:hypothetical protein
VAVRDAEGVVVPLEPALEPLTRVIGERDPAS